jgi:hypothetical protein
MPNRQIDFRKQMPDYREYYMQELKRASNIPRTMRKFRYMGLCPENKCYGFLDIILTEDCYVLPYCPICKTELPTMRGYEINDSCKSERGKVNG